MWTFPQVLLQLLTAFLASNSVSGQNGGRLIGPFEQTNVSLVRGTAYAANENTIIIEGFSFLSATSDDAFFYIGQELGQRPPIPYEEGGLAPLRNFINERVVIRLPGQSINDFQILYISTDNSQNSVGNLIIPEGLVLPTERRIGILGLTPIERDVLARDVVVINDRQLRLESFSYDGEAPATYFRVGQDTPSNFSRRVADENGIIDQPLSRYDERTIVLTLPDGLTVFGIDYLRVWSETLMVSFGHVMIPTDLDPQSVPMALFTTKVFENCEVLESDKFQVAWHRDMARDVVCFQLSGRVDPQEYMAFGISGLTTSTLMPVSDVTVGWIDGLTGQPVVVDYYVQEYTSCSPSLGACPDVILGGQDDVRLVASHILDGVTYITYEKPLTGDQTGHDQDIPFDRPVFISWAYGPIGISGLVATHVARNPQNLQLNFGRPSSSCPDFQLVVSQPCDSGPCMNGGSCSNTGASSFSCDCSTTGFTGARCQTAIFAVPLPCDLNPCRNDASCTNVADRIFRCDCQVGFTGPTCEGCSGVTLRTVGARSSYVSELRGHSLRSLALKRGDQPLGGDSVHHRGETAPPCDASPCQNGGDCINDGSVTAGFQCICTPDFEGPMCESAVCNPNPCQNGGTCVVVGNGLTFCFCANPFTGPTCQFLESGPCDGSSPCLNDGICNNLPGNTFTCDCSATLFTGRVCEVSPVRPCDNEPCFNGGTCVNDDVTGGYTCDCRTNFFGANCGEMLLPCDSSPCMNGGDCRSNIDDLSTFICSCPSNFRGTTCEEPACPFNPCMNSATCLVLPTGQTFCRCPDGFFGQFCQFADGVCGTVPCLNGGICMTNQAVARGYTCDCSNTDFVGDNCERINLCVNSPCENGGICIQQGIFLSCDCTGTGFTGPICRQPVTTFVCSTNPCLNGGRCSTTNGQLTCDCAGTGFTGPLCSELDDLCLRDSPCLNGGRCIQDGAAVTCDCSATDFSGMLCDQPDVISVCDTAPCLNGGTCVVFPILGDGFLCNCAGTGFTGPTCQLAACFSGFCSNGGLCVELESSLSCDCSGTGFTGPTCELTDNQIQPLSIECSPDVCRVGQPLGAFVQVTWDFPVITGGTPPYVRLRGPSGDSSFLQVGRSSTITYQYVDRENSVVECSFTIAAQTACQSTIQILNCPSDIEATVSGTQDTALVEWDELVVTGNAVRQVGGPMTNSGRYGVGRTTVSYVYQDGAGQIATCSFAVTVVVAIPPPVIENCPSDITETVNSPLDVAFVDWPDLVVTGDNVFRIIGPPISQGNYPVGTIPIQYIFQDGQGRTVSCSFTITVSVEAIPPPVIENCPSDITETVNSPLDVAYVDWPDLVVTGDDIFRIIGPPISQGNYPVGTTPIQYIFQDGQGRTVSCSFTITVSIGDPSSLFTGCPGDITETVLQGTGGSIVTWTPPTPRDATILLLTSPPRPPGSFFRVGSESIRYLYFASGNFQQCLFLVTVQEGNPCDTFSCLNGGTCIPVTPTEFTCACPGCFRGDRCENDLDPCSNSQCQNGGTCQPYIGSCDQYFCQCPSCFTGIRCQLRAEPCALVQCGNGGLCTPASVGCTEYSCQCQGCFTGAQCQEVLDPCSINPCQNGGLCRPISGDCSAYSCDCQGCFSGYNCEVAFDPCRINPCLNGGSCVNDPESCTAYRCECNLCNTGFRCELGIGNPCDAFPCNNGGTCELGDSCFTFTCFCPSGFGGLTCLDAAQTVTDPCASVPCSNGGSCLTLDEASYYCICRNGYRGINCGSAIDGLVVMSSCFTGICQNGGTCFNSFTSSRPVGTLFQYACLCPPEFTGLGCLTQTTSEECSTLPLNYCGANGVCQDLYISTLERVIPFCNCNPGFTGRFCNIPVEDPCATSPCRNGGQCTTFGLYFVCLCQRPYGGETCELLEGDITPPTILNCPSAPVVVRTSEGHAVVDWPELVFEDDSSFPVRIVSSNTARGAVYPVGTSFNAFFGVQDVFGNQAVCSFLVQVLQQ